MDTKATSPGAIGEFRSEFLQCWRRLPNKGIFFGLLAAWLLLFQFLGNSTFGYIDTPSLLEWMYSAYNSGNSEDGHGNLIPFVVLALFWWKRSDLLQLPMRTWSPGLVLLAVAVVIHLVGYLVQQPRISIIGLFAGIYALMGLAWGPQWLRGSFFPFFLFAFCVPLGSLGEGITFPLRLLVAEIVQEVASTGLGIDVMREGTQLFDSSRSFQYDVAPACSGIRSLVAMLALSTIYGFVSFKSGWKRVVMVSAALPLAVAGNVVRILVAVIITEVFGQEAGLWVEQKFGFVTFAVAIGAVLLLGHWMREPEAKSVEAKVV